MSRSTKLVFRVAVAAALAGALAGCSLLPKEESALKPPLVKPAKENYRTVKVEKGTLTKQISSIGYLESVATDMAQFTGQGGRIDEILVRSGDKVKKGDPLVKLIMDGLDLQLKEQELSYEKAKLAFRQARDAGEDQQRIAGLQLEIEQIKYDRLKKQFDSKILTSNIDGQVIFVEGLSEGDFVDPYQTIVTVADPSKLRIALRAESSNDIKDAEVGMTAQIKSKDKELTGKVVQTPSSAPQTLNRELADKYSKTLYIEADGLADIAEIGASVDVRIITQQKENVLKLPKSGVRSYLGRTFVRVLEDGSRIREVDIAQGLTTPTEVEIAQGLEEGQEIILQ